MFILLIAIALIIAVISFETSEDSKSTYFKITGNSYWNVINDKGKNGEYVLYRNLQRYENNNEKFLFNLYVNKNDEETTEIDEILLSHKGIIVFESKNYEGWIFGNVNDYQWTQSLKSGRRSKKYHFYNPIKQNETHIKSLKNLLGEYENIPIYSVIVFSNRSQFKTPFENTDTMKIIRMNYIGITMNNIYKNEDVLSDEDINNLFNKLYPYTQVTDSTKEKHINDIRVKIK